MTIAELKKFFTEHLVPSKLYQIGGESEGSICLEKVNDLWEVFFCEGKKKIGTMFFKDENSACSRMLKEVSKVMELVYDKKLYLA
ncbi:MAG: hypothetical protein IKS85_06760 [Lachnospiraceae bacterium]|nr:hypothetical protein [Lachnospiraceae bacterium]